MRNEYFSIGYTLDCFSNYVYCPLLFTTMDSSSLECFILYEVERGTESLFQNGSLRAAERA